MAEVDRIIVPEREKKILPAVEPNTSGLCQGLEGDDAMPDWR